MRKLRNAPDETKTQRLIEVLDEDKDGELNLEELRKVSMTVSHQKNNILSMVGSRHSSVLDGLVDSLILNKIFPSLGCKAFGRRRSGLESRTNCGSVRTIEGNTKNQSHRTND